jgi:hypothetical protein
VAHLPPKQRLATDVGCGSCGQPAAAGCNAGLRSGRSGTRQQLALGSSDVSAVIYSCCC